MAATSVIASKPNVPILICLSTGFFGTIYFSMKPFFTKNLFQIHHRINLEAEILRIARFSFLYLKILIECNVKSFNRYAIVLEQNLKCILKGKVNIIKVKRETQATIANCLFFEIRFEINNYFLF